MQRICTLVFGLLGIILLSAGTSALALSIALPTPTIQFPQGFDQKKADRIEAVLNDKSFKYIGGLYTHWPPKWSSTLTYEGDTKSLNVMIDRLTHLEGVQVRLTFSTDLSKEAGSALRAGSWWVIYSHVTPDTLTIRVNLASSQIDPSQLDVTLAPAVDELKAFPATPDDKGKK